MRDKPPPRPQSQVVLPNSASSIRAPGRERRGAKRVQPCERLEMLLALNKPLQVLDISTAGLLVEHEAAFKFGSSHDAELSRSDQKIRLRLQVVRSHLTRTAEKSNSAIRYRTGFQFLEAVPPAFFTLIPELSAEL